MSVESSPSNSKMMPAKDDRQIEGQPLLPIVLELSKQELNPVKFRAACGTVLKGAAPVVFNYFITSFAFMTSYNFLKGNATKETIGAYGISGSFLNIAVFSIIVSLNYGLLTKMSQAEGSQNYKQMGNYLHQGLLINMIALLFISILFIFSKEMLIAFGYNPEVASSVRHFLLWDMGAMFLYTIYSTLNYYLAACKIFKPMAYIQLIAAPSYVLVSYYLVEVHNLSLKGAAIASTVMYAILAILIIGYIYVKRPAPEALFLPTRQVFTGLWRLFKDEVMVGSMVFAEWVGLEIIALSSGTLPSNYLAAYSVGNSIMALAMNFPSALTTVLTSHISSKLAENQPLEARIFFRATLFIITCISVLFIFIFSAFGDAIASLMINDSEVIRDTLKLLRIYSFVLFFDYCQRILGAALRAADKKKFGFYVAMSSMYLVSIPLAMILCFVVGWGVYGLIMGIGFGVVFSFTCYAVGHVRLNWENQAKMISQKSSV